MATTSIGCTAYINPNFPWKLIHHPKTDQEPVPQRRVHWVEPGVADPVNRHDLIA
jgi:hypothetical protein